MIKAALTLGKKQGKAVGIPNFVGTILCPKARINGTIRLSELNSIVNYPYYGTFKLLSFENFRAVFLPTHFLLKLE